MPILILVWLVVINLWTLRCFRHDKRCAMQGRRRTPEVDLLRLAALGGSPAAFAGRRIYRHKTRKQPFSTRLTVIAMIQIGAVVGLFFAW